MQASNRRRRLRVHMTRVKYSIDGVDSDWSLGNTETDEKKKNEKESDEKNNKIETAQSRRRCTCVWENTWMG